MRHSGPAGTSEHICSTEQLQLFLKFVMIQVNTNDCNIQSNISDAPKSNF
jgi:hypothetical protein